jgi:TorA maturation chaperone TorD
MIRTSAYRISPADAVPDRSELAESRAQVYQILSLIYARPLDEKFLGLLRAWVMLQLRSETFPQTMKSGFRKIDVCLEELGSEGPAEALATLCTEFTRLFRGLNRFQSPPPPYESVYTDGGLVYGPSTDRVAQWYRRFHLRAHNNEPPDHISLELDFMRFLCEREARAWQIEKKARDLLEEEDTFLYDHLASWMPTFCQNIRTFDTTGFYSGLADVTEGWICCDQEIVKGLLDL